MTTRFVLPKGEAYEWPFAKGLLERFDAKVSSAGADECWEWNAFCNPRGYGMIRNAGRMALAHRIAWARKHGEIPAGKCVLHKCDNPPCVNEAHLYLGTNDDNVRDKVERGRSSFPQPRKRGENHPMAKLSQAQVDAIRATASGLRGEGRALAKEYGVCPATICNVLKGKVW